MKPVIYLGNSKDNIGNFPNIAKQRIITALTAVCAGATLSPAEFKYMPTVGPGAYEIRIKTDKQYRVFYIAKFEEAVYVLHAFVKKSQQTRKKDIQLGNSRYRSLISHRTRKTHEKN